MRCSHIRESKRSRKRRKTLEKEKAQTAALSSLTHSDELSTTTTVQGKAPWPRLREVNSKLIVFFCCLYYYRLSLPKVIWAECLHQNGESKKKKKKKKKKTTKKTTQNKKKKKRNKKKPFDKSKITITIKSYTSRRHAQNYTIFRFSDVSKREKVTTLGSGVYSWDTYIYVSTCHYLHRIKKKTDMVIHADRYKAIIIITIIIMKKKKGEKQKEKETHPCTRMHRQHRFSRNKYCQRTQTVQKQKQSKKQNNHSHTRTHTHKEMEPRKTTPFPIKHDQWREQPCFRCWWVE